MSEEDDLARRFFALWTEYLTALLSDPKMAEPMSRWLTLAAGALHGAAPGEAAARSPADAAPAAGAPGERDAVMVELARRIDELGERVAVLERAGRRRKRPAAGPRRGDRKAGS